MDQSSHAQLAEAILSNPVIGAAGMVVALVLLQYLKAWLPSFVGMAQPAARAPDPEPARQLGATLADATEAAEDMRDSLRAQVELLKRQVECLERVERTLAVSLAQDRTSPRAAPVRRPAGA